MDKELARAAQKIIIQAKSSVPDSRLYRQISEMTGAGELVGRKITFTPQCRVTIERVFGIELGQPLLSLKLDEVSREKAAVNPDEKWSKEGVFANLVTLTTVGKWPIKGEHSIPSGTIISGGRADFDFSKIEAVVLLENGEELTAWKQTALLMPPLFQGAVAIYRGHGDNQVKVKQLIMALDMPVGFYCDYDPSGLSIAMEYIDHPHHHLIIPDASPEKLHSASKSSAFIAQFPKLNRVLAAGNYISELAKPLAEYEIALMQEKIRSRRFNLVAHPKST